MTAAYRLVIGNKNYSSWSLRAWLLLAHFELPFEEILLPLCTPQFTDQIASYSPARRVPVLIDRSVSPALAVWDTLAIAEYLAERHPECSLWPTDPAARARARCISAEMHSGFSAVRRYMPMNVEARLPGLGWNLTVQRDIDRITQIWTTAREAYGAGGSFLFGSFSIADAFYAPVVLRFLTYGVTLPALAQAYAANILALPSLQQWIREAEAEKIFIAADEPYRLKADA